MVFSLVLVLCLVAGAWGQCSYSNICADHTLCKYGGVSQNCRAPTYFGVTSQKQAILNAHNDLRRKVAKGQESRGNPGPQPAAANMRKMYWDNELATIAQRWAEQCSFGHDSCRSVGRFYVGQNVYQEGTSGSPKNGNQNWQAAIQAWYNEAKDFSRNSINPFRFSESTGHYSQVVWANSYLVGCGFAAYTGADGWYQKYYVCNYGPGGNVIGTTMYDQGRACTKCQGSCDNSLCA